MLAADGEEAFAEGAVGGAALPVGDGDAGGGLCVAVAGTVGRRQQGSALGGGDVTGGFCGGVGAFLNLVAEREAFVVEVLREEDDVGESVVEREDDLGVLSALVLPSTSLVLCSTIVGSTP